MSNESFLLRKKSPNPSGPQKDVSSALVFGLILLLGIGLRFYDLGAESYWIDETSTVIESRQSIPQLLASGRLDQPPGYYFPFHLWVRIFGMGEVSTRSFSALAGIGSIVLIYLVGRELFGKPVGLLGAFLMAISQYQIYYSQIARFYSFFQLAALLSFFFFILALKNERKLYFAIYAAFSILMLYAHSHGVFILAAQNLFLLLQGRRYRNLISVWVISQVVIALAFIPYFYPLISGAGGVQGAADMNSGGTPRPSFWDLLSSAYRFIMPARRDRSWGMVLASYVAGAVVFAIGAGIQAVRRGKGETVLSARGLIASLSQLPREKGTLLLLGCWLLIPTLVPFILSLLLAPMYADRYVISVAPAFYLLLALGIFSIRRIVPVLISMAALVIMIAPGLQYYYQTDVNEQWKEVALYIEDTSGPGEVIVFAPDMGIGVQQKSFNWYYRGSLQRCGLPNQLIDPHAISEALNLCIAGHDRFWVIIPNYPSDINVPLYRSFFLGRNQNSLHMVQERQFVLLSVYLFELTK